MLGICYLVSPTVSAIDQKVAEISGRVVHLCTGSSPWIIESVPKHVPQLFLLLQPEPKPL